MKNYLVIAMWEGQEVTYVFPANSWKDAMAQAKEHGLFGDQPLRITRGDLTQEMAS